MGRPVGHILSNLDNYDRMIADIQEVLASLIPKEVEVRNNGGDWFTMRIQPYRTMDNVIEGAVVNFVNITSRKQMEEDIKKQLSEKELLLREVHHRIKNNIAAVGSLLSLQIQSVSKQGGPLCFAGRRRPCKQHESPLRQTPDQERLRRRLGEELYGRPYRFCAKSISREKATSQSIPK